MLSGKRGIVTAFPKKIPLVSERSIQIFRALFLGVRVKFFYHSIIHRKFPAKFGINIFSSFAFHLFVPPALLA